MNTRAKTSTLQASALLTVAGLLLASGVACAQAPAAVHPEAVHPEAVHPEAVHPEAVDLEKAAALHQRETWPVSDLLRGVELPEDLPGLVADGSTAPERVLAEIGFVQFGSDLLSTRTRRVVEEGAVVLQLEVMVAESQRAAQDAMLTLVALTHSVLAGPGAREWTREPFADATLERAGTWSVLGDVRIGLPSASGVARVVFTRGNVLVRILAEPQVEARLLPVAVAVDELIARSPERAEGDDAVTAIHIGSPVTWRHMAPVTLAREGDGQLSFDFAVTGGMVTEGEGGERVYYAGDLGEQSVSVRAVDSFGFPSSARVTIGVAED